LECITRHPLDRLGQKAALLGSALLLCLVLISGCVTDQGSRKPEIKAGILDLRGWDFNRDGRLDLSGEWAFYWKQLLTGLDFKGPAAPQSSGLYSIPGTWNGKEVNGETLGGEGYATFVLEVLIDPRDKPLAFKVQDVDTAYALYVDDELVAKNGTVGVTPASMVPEFRPLTETFTAAGDRFRIILQVSNFHHRRGGPWSAIQLGSAENIRAIADRTKVANGFFIGSIFIMALYHLFLYTLRHNERSYLFFGIFCGLITLRSLLVGERYLHMLFPGISWEILQKVEYLTFYLAVPLFVMFLASLFPDEFHQRVIRLIQVVAAGFVAVVLLTKAWTFTATVNAFQILTILTAGYLFFTLYRAYRRKREGILILLAGYLFLFITVVNEILFVNGLIQTGYSIPLGMFVFIFSQAFMLSQRYSSAFAEIAVQKGELVSTNQAFKQEIVSRQLLEGKLRQSLQDFEESRYGLILGLAKLAEYRDEDTGTHLERMREYVKILTKRLARTDKYRNYISENYILDIYQSSILHDIGKVGIRDSILLKPARLTEEEFREMKMHSTIGGNAIKAVEDEIQVRSFLTLGREIAYHHHEKWNGQGYPAGLKEENIPLSARITALADVYDALTSVRPYKKAFSHEKAAEIIFGDSGTHFDPDVVEAFRAEEQRFNKVREYLKD